MGAEPALSHRRGTLFGMISAELDGLYCGISDLSGEELGCKLKCVKAGTTVGEDCSTGSGMLNQLDIWLI